jgi:hypothetical protein
MSIASTASVKLPLTTSPNKLQAYETRKIFAPTRARRID